MPVILFVCTANRYRSPIAAACFRRELATRQLGAGWQVSSAGTWTADGMPAMPGAISGARRLGLDIGDHRSRVITSELVRGADAIIVMEEGQKEALQVEFPQNAHKVHMLSEAATGAAYDIPDPTLSSSASEICREIDELIHKGFERISELAGKR